MSIISSQFIFDVSSAIIDQTTVTTFQSITISNIKDTYNLYQNHSTGTIYSCINNPINFKAFDIRGNCNIQPNLTRVNLKTISYLFNLSLVSLNIPINGIQDLIGPINVYPYIPNFPTDTTLGGWVWSNLTDTTNPLNYYLTIPASTATLPYGTISITTCSTPIPSDFTNTSAGVPILTSNCSPDINNNIYVTPKYLEEINFWEFITLNNSTKKNKSSLSKIYLSSSINYNFTFTDETLLFYQSIIGMVHSCYLCSSFNSQSYPSVTIQNQATEIFLNSTLIYNEYLNLLAKPLQ